MYALEDSLGVYELMAVAQRAVGSQNLYLTDIAYLIKSIYLVFFMDVKGLFIQKIKIEQ